jgi:DNA polymerase-3 subunit beta
VSGRSTQPVQNNVFFEATGGSLRMVASDLEFIHLEAIIPAEVVEEGAITVPARLLVQVTASLPPGLVELEATAHDSLRLTGGRSRYDIRGLASEDFDMLPPLDGAVAIELPQRVLHQVVTQTIFAVLPDATRPILTGVHFSIGDGRIEVVATDTYRLAMRRITPETPGVAPIEIPEPRQAIVAARCLHELLRLLDADAEDPVRIALTENLVEFTFGTVKIASRLIEGKFPSYEKVLPSGHDKTVLVSVADLQAALRRVLVVAREDANRAVFRVGGEVMTVTAEHPDVGRSEEELEAELEGEPVEIAFNARYLLDVLEPMSEGRVRIDLAGSMNACTLRPEGDEEYLYVLMPMQILGGR